jgi:hypothetical protein
MTQELIEGNNSRSGRADLSHLPRGTPLSTKVGNKFIEQRQSLSRYIRL